jgi:hypothetical protein
MGFLIQWVVYLLAFVAGSAAAYGIATRMIKTSEDHGENEAPGSEIESAEPKASEALPASAEAPTIAVERSVSESQPESSDSEIGAKG